jgi:4-hydroxythreonine-4-phosphate dehydrogenase
MARCSSLTGLPLAHNRMRLEYVSSLADPGEFEGPLLAQHGRAQLDAIDTALALVVAQKANALVTAPVAKHVISLTGEVFTGHTEYIAQRCESRTPVMAFWGPALRTSLVTTHLSLKDVSAALSLSKITTVIAVTARALWRDLAITKPRIVVCAVNPHVGENGLLGREEIEVIEPAVDAARDVLGDLAQIDGPMGAETAFRLAKDGTYDSVVAMYHDQATIASKLLDFGDAVNVTLGLPLIRTSVDHGTAYDLAYTGRADHRPMLRALELAAKLAAHNTRDA